MPRAVELEIDEACEWYVLESEVSFLRRQLMDTKYFQQALEEYAVKKSAHLKAGDLTLGELSWLMRRAQELKDADDTAAQAHGRANARELLQSAVTVRPVGDKPQPIVDLLDHAEEIR